MIIVDLSNILYASVLDFFSKTKEQPRLDVIRTLVISRLINIKKKLRDDEVVLAIDARRSWRKDVFPHYKANRATARENDESKFDWDLFFQDANGLKDELKEFFPVKFIEVDGAEADDVMAVLAARFGPHRDVVLVTADHDMLQIQETMCPKVKHWSPWHTKFLTPKSQGYTLLEHVIRGDGGDGIPNCLSDDDVLVVKEKRQKSIKKTLVETAKSYGIEQPEMFLSGQGLTGFHRNRAVIDFRMIPMNLQNEIAEAYDNAQTPRGKLFTYLTANRLTKILADGGW
jgi:hypothetical protein